MRKTIYFIGILLAMLACSKDDNVAPGAKVEEDSIENRLLKVISDTTGLKLFGIGETYGKTDTLICMLGSKYNKLWCGFFSGNDSIDYKEEFVYVSNENLQTSWEVDAGYGEIEIITLPIDEGLGFVGIQCSLFDKNTFAISGRFPTKTTYLPYSIIVNQSKISYKNIYIARTWAEGYYWGRPANGDTATVFDLNGDIVFIQDEEFESQHLGDANKMLPISLHDCICFTLDAWNNYITVTHINTVDCSERWGYQLCIGKTINNNAPRISYTRSLDGNILTLEASATNYDGTQETGFFQIDIDTEEIIANDGFTINQAQ